MPTGLHGRAFSRQFGAVLTAVALVAGLLISAQPTRAAPELCDCAGFETAVADAQLHLGDAENELADAAAVRALLEQATLGAEADLILAGHRYDSLNSQITRLYDERASIAQGIVAYDELKRDVLSNLRVLDGFYSAADGLFRTTRAVMASLPELYHSRTSIERLAAEFVASNGLAGQLQALIERDQWVLASLGATAFQFVLAALYVRLVGLAVAVTVVLPPPLQLQVRTAFGVVGVAATTVSAVFGYRLNTLMGRAAGAHRDAADARDEIDEIDVDIAQAEHELAGLATQLQSLAELADAAMNDLRTHETEVVAPLAAAEQQARERLDALRLQLAECTDGADGQCGGASTTTTSTTTTSTTTTSTTTTSTTTTSTSTTTLPTDDFLEWCESRVYAQIGPCLYSTTWWPQVRVHFDASHFEMGPCTAAQRIRIDWGDGSEPTEVVARLGDGSPRPVGGGFHYYPREGGTFTIRAEAIANEGSGGFTECAFSEYFTIRLKDREADDSET